ncbi:hypothetical protein G9U51_13290 [Calidifontibacter sp. DB0510]|uniref:Uncharacterized protein n=1 Tax=Metallococcus carri TaxID=1656884 RepID=A0A967B0W7_9MICO|nr:hypothetical protein [Metallococcus carri]NHN56751.1 hypothetical protein [Metallococcus carri]NOP37872.1 hypothetical protein [Calidifontibacter sp. DB2511S]
MTHEDLEQRLRSAFAAQADEVTPNSLDQRKQRDTLFALQRRPQSGRRRALAAGVAAVAAAGIAGTAVALSGGGPVGNAALGSPSSTAGGGNTPDWASMKVQPSSPSPTTVGKLSVTGPESATGKGPLAKATMTPQFAMTGKQLTVTVTLDDPQGQKVQFVQVMVDPDTSGMMTPNNIQRCMTQSTKQGLKVTLKQPPVTIEDPGTHVLRIVARVCGSEPTPYEVVWNGTVNAR